MINNNNIPRLSDLIDENSWYILEKAKQYLNVVGVPSTLGQLSENPQHWPELMEFQMLAPWISEIPVTNDGSERAVKDAQDVTSSSYTQEGRKDTMLVKSEHRRKFPKLCKRNKKWINEQLQIVFVLNLQFTYMNKYIFFPFLHQLIQYTLLLSGSIKDFGILLITPVFFVYLMTAYQQKNNKI